jgi:hypothetical protein
LQISQSSDSDRPFEVDGDTFTSFSDAANRACDNQKNACADLFNNSGDKDSVGFDVGDCDSQNCKQYPLIPPLLSTLFPFEMFLLEYFVLS